MIGYREKIRDARKASDVRRLLKRALSLNAPEKTERRWKLAADRALSRLNKETNNPKKIVSEKNKKSKKANSKELS